MATTRTFSTKVLKDPGVDVIENPLTVVRNEGIIVLLTKAIGAATLPTPSRSLGGANEFSVTNSTDSTFSIVVNNETILPGQSLSFRWADGAWAVLSGVPSKTIDGILDKATPFVEIAVSAASGLAGTPILATVTVLDEEGGSPVLSSTIMELAVFDDSKVSIPSITGELDNASVGSIVGGAGSTASKIETSVGGVFTCEFTSFAKGSFYLSCDQSAGSPALRTTRITQVDLT